MSTERMPIRNMAGLVAFAAGLQAAEAVIPHPVPGVRLGLANVISLVVLVQFGTTAALEVSMLRTVVSALVLGTFLAPPFFLSFGAAAASTLVMAALYGLLTRTRRPVLSMVGISVVGATAHNLAQLVLAYLLIVRHKGVLVLLPWLGLSAVATGWMTGLLAGAVCRRLGTVRPVRTGASHRNASALPTLPPLERARLLWGALILAGMIAGAFALSDVQHLSILLVLSVASACLVRHALSPVLLALGRRTPILLLAFLIPVLFAGQGRTVLSQGLVRVTEEGLRTGTLFALRLAILMALARLLAAVVPPPSLAAWLQRTGREHTVVGRTAGILAHALELANAGASSRRRGSARLVCEPASRRTVPALADRVAALYAEALANDEDTKKDHDR